MRKLSRGNLLAPAQRSQLGLARVNWCSHNRSRFARCCALTTSSSTPEYLPAIRKSSAEAFAVKGDRFLAVGSSADIRALAGSNTEIIDAEGMFVTPGFIDAHSHPSGAGVNELVRVNADSLCLGHCRRAWERAGSVPAGQWIQAFKYDDTKLSEGRPES